ncbi:hypothetical protein ACQR1I_36740 [Bradyrhizobium sp. HKCCYLS2038]|uniref:hypothetical protein n=1 Tax=Bradyrhizobium sp. HKCCYLS2038 TaxID=3420764 RepID=UPI003EBBDA6D
MTKTRETITGTKAFAERLANCDINFAAQVVRIAGVSEADAYKVLNVYTKHKLIKRDTCNQTWIVKHGGFLERDVILRALASAAA